MKRLLSLLLTVVMIVALVPLGTVNASGQVPVITVDDVIAAPGSTVEVNVTIANNPGIISAMLDVTFGADLLLTGAIF